MRHRRLGRTGLEVSELALGTWGLSGDAYGPTSEAEQDRVIDRARAVGITLFDTADCYGSGEMERRLGRRLQKDDRALIITKIGTDRDSSPPRKRFDATFLERAFVKSQERLARTKLDIVLLHNPSAAALNRREASEACEKLVQSGQLSAWGVSVTTEEQARTAIECGAQVLELPYNAFYMEPLHHLSELIREKEVGVLARSVLAHGLLCGHWSYDKTFGDGDHRAERWTTEELRRRLAQLNALRPVVGGPVASLRAAALRYVLSNEQVSSAVLGPKSCIQLDQLVREAGKEPPYLATDKLSALSNRLRDVGVVR
jgi:aryl-alcohol dehydrogenase-like predicted oxidoreductase